MAGRRGFFGKILDFANKFYPKSARSERKSRFEGFEVDPKNEPMRRAISLCDEALDIVSDRIILMNRLRDVTAKIAEVEGYNSLTDEDAQEFKDLLGRYSSLARESRQLQYQTTSFDHDVTYMEKHEDEAPKAIDEIKFAEDRQRIFKQDMGYLEGEKMVLEDDSQRLQNAFDFVEKFSVGCVIFFGALAAFLVFLHAFRDFQVTFLLIAMSVFIVIIAGLIYSLRIRLKQEIALNIRKQQRAVELLNKKTAVYAHFTNFLNYEYRKFKVRNSQMLKNNLNEYNNYKHLIRRLDSVRNILAQTEVAIEFFLKDKGIDVNYSNVEKFAQTINIDDKKQFYNEMNREKGLVERSLAVLEQRHTDVWGELMNIQENDENEDMKRLIDEYMVKAGKMMVYDETRDEDGVIV